VGERDFNVIYKVQLKYLFHHPREFSSKWGGVSMNIKQDAFAGWLIISLFAWLICSANVLADDQFIKNTSIQARSDLAAPIDNTISDFHSLYKPNHVRGARIFDDYTVELDRVQIEINPFLAFATPTDPTMPVPSFDESWRCTHCHGFDYQGGKYTFQNGATTNLIQSINLRKLDEDYVVNLLMSGLNVYNGTTHVNVHNYSDFFLGLDIQSMVDVADFVVNELYDVDEYVRRTNNEALLNHMPSMFIYKGSKDPILIPEPLAVRLNGINFKCTDCHGIDGRLVPGFDLYDLSWTQPYKWMHRVNFGTPRSQALYINITTQDGTIHPGVYEVILINGLHMGGSRQTAELLEYVQTHFNP